MAQTWQDLLFAHWRVPISVVRANVPAELPIDEFDGAAWVGVTPFRLTGLRARWTYPLPVLSVFPELNVRTYVTLGGKPGIYFFSLDAGSALAVTAAKRFYRLPYFWSEVAVRSEGGEVVYRSRRRGEGSRRFAATYRPEGRELQARPGSLEHFLTERYCLYTVDEGVVLRAEIHHPPWPLQPADATLRENTMAPPGMESKAGRSFTSQRGKTSSSGRLDEGRGAVCKCLRRYGGRGCPRAARRLAGSEHRSRIAPARSSPGKVRSSACQSDRFPVTPVCSASSSARRLSGE